MMGEIISSGNGAVIVELQWKRYELAALNLDDLFEVEKHLTQLRIASVADAHKAGKIKDDVVHDVLLQALCWLPSAVDVLKFLSTLSGARYMLALAFERAYPEMGIDEVLVLFDGDWKLVIEVAVALVTAANVSGLGLESKEGE